MGSVIESETRSVLLRCPISWEVRLADERSQVPLLQTYFRNAMHTELYKNNSAKFCDLFKICHFVTTVATKVIPMLDIIKHILCLPWARKRVKTSFMAQGSSRDAVNNAQRWYYRDGTLDIQSHEPPSKSQGWPRAFKMEQSRQLLHVSAKQFCHLGVASTLPHSWGWMMHVWEGYSNDNPVF